MTLNSVRQSAKITHGSQYLESSQVFTLFPPFWTKIPMVYSWAIFKIQHMKPLLKICLEYSLRDSPSSYLSGPHILPYLTSSEQEVASWCPCSQVPTHTPGLKHLGSSGQVRALSLSLSPSPHLLPLRPSPSLPPSHLSTGWSSCLDFPNLTLKVTGCQFCHILLAKKIPSLPGSREGT